MSDEKDHVREQMNDLADAYVKLQGSHDNPEITHHDFLNGLITQDAIAWNRCLDEVIKVFKNNDHLFHYASDYITIIQEVEKLRR